MVVRCRCVWCECITLSDGNVFVTGALPKRRTVSTCCTEVYCVIRLMDTGNRQIDVGLRVARDAKPVVEQPLHLHVLVVNHPDHGHVTSRPLDRPVLEPVHVGVVRVSMTTVEADILKTVCDKMSRRLVDDEGREDKLWTSSLKKKKNEKKKKNKNRIFK